jgi:hypothetical protein
VYLQPSINFEEPLLLLKSLPPLVTRVGKTDMSALSYQLPMVAKERLKYSVDQTARIA